MTTPTNIRDLILSELAEGIADIPRVIQAAEDLLMYGDTHDGERTMKKKRQCVCSQSRKMWYRRYLQSTEWGAKRGAALNRDQFTCRRCKTSTLNLEVHHLTYDRAGFEDLGDLITLCCRCHRLAHMNPTAYEIPLQVEPVEPPQPWKVELREIHEKQEALIGQVREAEAEGAYEVVLALLRENDKLLERRRALCLSKHE